MPMQLAEDLPGVSLAVSLHAPTQELRQTIVPSAKAYPLQKLMATLDTYLDKQDQKSPKVKPAELASASASSCKLASACSYPFFNH